MTCPNCRLINPPSAKTCDCGYDFETGVVGKSYLSPKEQALSRVRPIDPRASGLAFAAAVVFVLVVLGATRVSGPKGPIGVATYFIGITAVIVVAVVMVLLFSRKVRADAALFVAAGLGAWVGLYAGLRVLL